MKTSLHPYDTTPLTIRTELIIAMTLSTPAEPYDFDALWDYHNPAETEAKFRDLLKKAEPSEHFAYHAELLTQIARTLGLQQKFDSAHAMLDQVEPMLDEAGDRVHVRYLLERGRTYRSAGKVDLATPLFEDAWARAAGGGLDFYGVDAAHMLGIVIAGDGGMEWNLKAIARAEASNDPRARNWLGSLYNNTGWTHFDAKEYDNALDMFTHALDFRKQQDKPRETLIARWCVAKTLRFLGQVESALAIQHSLLDAWAALGEPDGFVHEEIGECLFLLNQPQNAAPHFKKAFELLSEDIWIRRDEPDRLNRLKELGTPAH